LCTRLSYNPKNLLLWQAGPPILMLFSNTGILVPY